MTYQLKTPLAEVTISTYYPQGNRSITEIEIELDGQTAKAEINIDDMIETLQAHKRGLAKPE
jgi:hypothetical protein